MNLREVATTQALRSSGLFQLLERAVIALESIAESLSTKDMK